MLGVCLHDAVCRLGGEPADAVHASFQEQSCVDGDVHGSVGVDCAVDDAGEIFFFQEVYFCGKSVGRVVWCDGTTCLFQGCSAVVVFVDYVDGDAALVFAGGYDGFVDVVAVHAFAAVFGEQCGVDVDDAVRVGVEHILWHEPEEAGEDDPVDLFLAQVVEHGGALVEVFASEVAGLDAEVAGALGDVGILYIIYNTGHLHIVAPGEVFADLLCVGAIARAEDGQSDG